MGSGKSLKNALQAHQNRIKAKEKATHAAQIAEQKARRVSGGRPSPGRKARPKGPSIKRWTIPFQPTDTILLIGEGNFSFARALARCSTSRIELAHLVNFPSKNITATAYDSEEEVYSKYPEAKDIVSTLRERGVEVLFSVDAAKLEWTAGLKGRTWSKIVWNFPHAGKGIDDQDRNILSNQILIRGFLHSAAKFLKKGPVPNITGNKRRMVAAADDDNDNDDEGIQSDIEDENDVTASNRGTVLITLRNVPPYTSWDVPRLAKNPPPPTQGSMSPNPRYAILRSFVFHREMWDGYEHRMTKGSRAHGKGITGGGGEDRTWEFYLSELDDVVGSPTVSRLPNRNDESMQATRLIRFGRQSLAGQTLQCFQPRRLMHYLKPWIKQSGTASRKTVEERLHHDIVDFTAYVQRTSAEVIIYESLFSSLSKTIRQAMRPKTVKRVDQFGSSRIGLGLPGSDLDVVVTTSETDSRLIRKLPFILASHLKRSNVVQSEIRVNHYAPIPIVKCQSVKDLGNISIDISFDNVRDGGPSQGVKVGHAVQSHLNVQPALAPLVLVLKAFLKQRNLGSALTGGLGSYPLIVMIIHFLQLNPTGLPRESIMNPLDKNVHSLGRLLIDFFFYYSAQFPYETAYISVQSAPVIGSAGPSTSTTQPREHGTSEPGEIKEEVIFEPKQSGLKLRADAPWIKSSPNLCKAAIQCLIEPGIDRHRRGTSRIKAVAQEFKEVAAFLVQLQDAKEDILGQIVGLPEEDISHRALIGEIVQRKSTTNSSHRNNSKRPHPDESNTKKDERRVIRRTEGKFEPRFRAQ
ncbi:hypothetical protein D9757_008004 [Collybiopsis confluens]|uniref:polynucleotide adenylyltransferase n=1 Tax=Collybiopsis confluens TaxID=2823264 RepID=A0A8H5M1M2_9AGAR|nr:hypothetical protein D9757_008004 [Collybiopsis confluens]